MIGYELARGQIVDSISIWTNQRGLGPYGGKGGTLMGKKLGIAGEGIVDLQVVGKRWKAVQLIEDIVSPIWEPFAITNTNSSW